MEQKYIINDIVLYNNKIMVIKEPRDGIHFDLSCPEEGLTYCFVNVNEIKPVRLTFAIFEKNGWEHNGRYFVKDSIILYPEVDYFVFDGFETKIKYVHQLQHLFFGLKRYSEMEV